MYYLRAPATDLSQVSLEKLAATFLNSIPVLSKAQTETIPA